MELNQVDKNECNSAKNDNRYFKLPGAARLAKYKHFTHCHNSLANTNLNSLNISKRGSLNGAETFGKNNSPRNSDTENNSEQI